MQPLRLASLLAFVGLLIFILLTVWTVFLGRSNAGRPMGCLGEGSP